MVNFAATYRTLHVCNRTFIMFFVLIQVLASSCNAAKSSDLELCPFEIHIDEDPTRLPKDIKHHTCSKSVSRNVMEHGDQKKRSDEDSSWSCASIGGHCVQEHDTIKVSYRHRAIHKHDVRFNRSCKCVPLRGKPARPILPSFTR